MPSATSTRNSRPNRNVNHVRSLKRKRDLENHEALQKAVQELDTISATFNDFSDLPLCQATAAGLESSHFKKMTDIQSRAIPLALKGKDILGAARTGSGKTLAFLIPVLDNLYRHRWTELDGLGALIISPTRELALQIFEVLRKIGRHHSFSAGLVIGGRSLREERERLGKMNILVCTPGRMLQHMDQTATFDVGNLQMLVLDEADRIMDMGFQHSVDAIIEHLPCQRQTLLFSATQTKKVSDLARLSLQNPEYVAVHEAASSATPSTLQQFYVVTPLPEKMNTLFSFIKSNLKSKIIVFLSSGKQVRFVYESFRMLQPGIPLLHLHGRQKQTARLDITSKFSASKNSCIFATDVVARGLDFPAVDWVIQLDCPEDADTYIHRVGRTARYERDGKAALFLDPSEVDGMLHQLEHKKVPIQQTKPREKKQQKIDSQLQNMCFQNPELKYLGQKAFTSYAKSLFLQKDKEIFKLDKYDLEGFASSLGLPGAPKIKFQKGEDARKIKNAPRALLSSSDNDDKEESSKKIKKGEVRTKYDRMFERRNQDILSGHYSKMIAENQLDQSQLEDADEDNDFLSVKRVITADSENLGDNVPQAAEGSLVKVISGVGKEQIIVDSKRKEKLLKSKKKLLKYKDRGTKLVYDEDGNPHQIYELEDENSFLKKGAPESQRVKFLEEETARIQAADIDDKELAKRKKQLKRDKKRAARQAIEIISDQESVTNPTLVQSTGDRTDDPLAFLASLSQAGGDTEGRHPKRQKKWFEDNTDDEKERRINKKGYDQPDEDLDSLENLESLAAQLLK
ncbi:ATP-dependent RNA helicase dbp4 [Golovinomyces cichoracearum]|uniref:ATP-dependent RNA helicase n=1 Tax=Golovinomyces cichoracearum TaxID=62708 RepID=A0A420I7W8_9PEZI|nr:ATP-dependent RNA helicase dbp4 [Golovinomyces cichoracearum]